MNNEQIAALIARIKGPLPRLVVHVGTNEKADEYRLIVSNAERGVISDALSRVMATEVPSDAKDVMVGWAQIYRWDGGDALKEATEEIDVLLKKLDEAGFAVVAKGSPLPPA